MNDIDYVLETALNALRKRYHSLNYRNNGGVWLSPLERFTYDIIPVLEAFLKNAYDAFHNEPWTTDVEFRKSYINELKLARKIVKSEYALPPRKDPRD